MKKIKLVTDSTCDLSKSLIEKYDITVIPLYVNFGEETYKDGVDIVVSQMYQMVKEKGSLPKTAAPSPGVFEETFRDLLNDYDDILYLGIGSKFSASFNSAFIAKNMIGSEHIHLVDSLNLSSGSGLLLLKAGEMIQAGLAIDDLISRVKEMIPKVKSQFVINTLEYLYKGGRLNALSAFVGGMLKLKPIIKVRNGEMAVGKKGRGHLRHGINIMIKEMLADKDDIDPDFLMITHSMAVEEADYICDKIQNQVDIKNIYETEAGCVISSHCGKKTIGILYMTK